MTKNQRLIYVSNAIVQRELFAYVVKIICKYVGFLVALLHLLVALSVFLLSSGAHAPPGGFVRCINVGLHYYHFKFHRI